MGVIHLSYPYSRLCTRSILHSGGGERRQVHAVVDGLPFYLHKQRRQRDGQIRQHKQRERQSESDLFPRRRVDTPPLAGHGDAAQHQQRGQDTAHALQQGPHGEPYAVPLHKSQRRQRQVGQQTQGRQDKRRQDGHGHIEAAPAALGRALQQLRAVAAEHLYVALGPAQPLPAGLPEIGGLLVIEHRVLADGDPLAPQNVVDGKLDILRQQIEPPAMALVQYPLREQKACPAHGGAAAQPVPRAVQIAALPQEPQGVPGADPIVAEVFAVAVAGHDLVSGGEALVHALEVVRREDVVRIEHEVAVKALRIVCADVLQQKIQGIALTHVHMIEALVHHRPVCPCDGGGAVGAVVRRHEHRHQGHIVGLRGQ